MVKSPNFQPCAPRKWRSLLSQATNLDGAMQTIRLGGAVADELKQFRWDELGGWLLLYSSLCCFWCRNNWRIPKGSVLGSLPSNIYVVLMSLLGVFWFDQVGREESSYEGRRRYQGTDCCQPRVRLKVWVDWRRWRYTIWKHQSLYNTSTVNSCLFVLKPFGSWNDSCWFSPCTSQILTQWHCYVSCQDQFAPLFKAKLWKVKAEGHFSQEVFFVGGNGKLSQEVGQ